VFQNRVWRKIFGPRMKEAREDWGNLHSDESEVMYTSPDVSRMVKSRRLMWKGHVARMGEKGNIS
jgi:hypothetical protein